VADDKEKFLTRWSRLKQENSLPEKTEDKHDSPVPVLPAIDKLDPESDFTGFMHPKVDDALRRVALKKLFSDPHFNLPDPYEAYSGDWTVGEPISEELLAGLNQARTLLFDKSDTEAGPPKEPVSDAVVENEPEPKADERRSENT
jgi:hypothetical protein